MIGQRVKLAREAAFQTQTELAERIGKSQRAIAEIESGHVADPADETLRAISVATGFPVGFFYLGPLPDLPEGHYRKRARATAKQQKKLRAQVRQVVELLDRAETVVRMPPVSITPVRTELSPVEIEEYASEVRRLLGLGDLDPIPNAMRAVERAGVAVVRLPGEASNHDGFSAWPDSGLDGRPIIALTAGHPGDRDRFTLLHELSHLILHTARPLTDPKQAEVEANQLTGALLLPRDAARAALRPPVTLRVLMNVKATYGISMAAAARRGKELNLISESQLISIYKQLSARQWRKVEPVDVPQEMPVLVAKAIGALAGEGPLTEQADRLCMSPFTLRSLVA